MKQEIPEVLRTLSAQASEVTANLQLTEEPLDCLGLYSEELMVKAQHISNALDLIDNSQRQNVQ